MPAASDPAMNWRAAPAYRNGRPEPGFYRRGAPRHPWIERAILLARADIEEYDRQIQAAATPGRKPSGRPAPPPTARQLELSAARCRAYRARKSAGKERSGTPERGE